MRRGLSSLLLALCLVFGQQGALLHALRHELPHAGAASDDEFASHAAGVGCVTCLAFAHIAGVATSPAASPPPLLSLAFHWSAAAVFARRPADVPLARARDPPGFF